MRILRAYVYAVYAEKEDQRKPLTNAWVKEGLGLGPELNRLKEFTKRLTQAPTAPSV